MKQLLVTGVLLFGFGHLAFGALGYELELTDGTNTAIINSSGVLVTNYVCATCTASANLATGVFTFNGPLGNYNVNVSTGQGSPTLPLGGLDLNSVDTASGSASGPLTIEWSENGIATVLSSWTMAFGGTLNSGAGATISNSDFQSNSNMFFATTNKIATIGPFGPGAFSGSASGSVAGVTAPYSLTDVINLNGVGTTGFSGDANLAPVPEPASVVLFGGVVLAIATTLRRKLNRA